MRGDRPYPWIGAACFEVRQNERIVSVAVIIAAGVNDGGRAVIGDFPDEAAVSSLVGAILLELNDEWAVQRA
jgi:transposase-like protein